MEGDTAGVLQVDGQSHHAMMLGKCGCNNAYASGLVMFKPHQTFILIILLITAIDPVYAQLRGGANIEFDQNITPDAIFGSGNANGSFTTDRRNGIEIGLRGKIRFNANGQPENTFNSNGDGSYTFIASVAPGRPDDTPEWNFEWSVNTDFDDTSGLVISDLTYELGLDGDPGEGTDFLIFDPITPSAQAPFFDHSIGDNSTANGAGTEATNPGEYLTLIDSNNVVQNSWRYPFFLSGPLTDFNAKLEGRYDIYLLARDSKGAVVARSDIRIIMVNPPLEFDQDATPDAIFGSGNANGAFTTDRRNGIETALRAFLRFNEMGLPENTFNSNGDGTFSFAAGQAVGQSAQTAVWAFDWSMNTDFNSVLSNGLVLSDLTYELGLDGDPSLATDFLVFDPITPSAQVPFFDHAIGDNNTANGAGVEATNPVEYQMLIDNNNVAQNSWRYSFFLAGALQNFDPTVDGTYTIYLLARDDEGIVVNRSQIQVLVGDTAVAGSVAEVSIEKTTNATGTQLTGDSFDYFLTVTNTDVATATGVLVSDDLPDNLTFNSGSCDDGSTAVQAGQLITFNLDDLVTGATTVCTINVTVSAGGLITNTATVAADNDFDPANNTSTISVLGIIQSTGLSGDVPSAEDNDYTRINNVLVAVMPGDVIILEGLFDWVEPNAFDSWAMGSDGVPDTEDDFSILLPEGAGDFTLTAAELGDAVIQGPGDLAGQDLEGFLVVSSTDNQNIEISNLTVQNFDLGIGFFFDGGGVNVYDNTRIMNNRIVVATDIAGNEAAGEGFQNIGIHFAFGDNQRISGNIIEISGDGVSNRPTLTAASVGMQSNTSSGAYEGLIVEDNIVRVLNAQTADPEFILGIWENSNAFERNIIIRNNRFENLNPMNNPALNMQQGFRITSQSSPDTSDGALMTGNFVEGANVAYEWLPGRFGANFETRGPLPFIANTAVNNMIGVRLDSNGSAEMSCNRFVNNDTAIENVTDDNIASLANDNWWGCNAGPNMGACDGFDAGANVTADSWLVANVTANPNSVEAGGMTDLTLDVTLNNNSVQVIDCALPDGVPVAFTTDFGIVIPANTDTVAGVAPAIYNAPGVPGIATVGAAIDNEVATDMIQVLGPPSITAVNPDPLPGNVFRTDAVISGSGFIPETVILAAGLPRETVFIDANTVMVTLLEEDLEVIGSGGINLIADNTAVPGGGQSAPFFVNIVDDLVFRDGYEQ